MAARKRRATRNRPIVVTTLDGTRLMARPVTRKCTLTICIRDPKTKIEVCKTYEVECNLDLPFPFPPSWG